MLEDAGVDQVLRRREHGNTAGMILVVAADIGSKRNTISGHKRTLTEKLIFRSATPSVLLTAYRPVLTVMSG